MPSFQPSRRRLLQWGASGPLLAVLGACAHEGAVAGSENAVRLRVLAISDLHSSYGRIAHLLAAFRNEVANHAAPHLIVVNGDSFEHGNVVSVRSEGAIDWAFMEELPKIAPTVFNIGNHDNDLILDLHPVVARIRALGITVVSNIIDKRTGQAFAPATADLTIGGQRLRIVGMGTPSLNSYPQASREWLQIPEPKAWARENFPAMLSAEGMKLVLSHVGVVDEREYLPLVPQGTLMIGGHNHLLFTHQDGATGYMHPGRWGETYTVGEYGADGRVRTAIVDVPTEGSGDPRLASLVASTLAAHLTDVERKILGETQHALTLGDTARGVCRGFADAADADWGFIGHTTLGTGLKAGPIDQFHFDEVVRFDGRLQVAEVDASRMAAILKVCNQDRPIPIEEMTGDFIYAAERSSGARSQGNLRLVTTDWCARNQSKYFGTTDLVFVDVPSDGVKAVARRALLG
ncbi:metallophosphoesterase [Brevundimonas pishanensis]|uniref:metallophosphoesterase n=1 Tax=Brevundimonas pishanensis TaxID=2896315 RepID=UPI001FA80317|nr:metallophosphoesterase [Brevundimonas pishanensis]